VGLAHSGLSVPPFRSCRPAGQEFSQSLKVRPPVPHQDVELLRCREREFTVSPEHWSGDVEVECVDFLGASVAHEDGGAIGG
jgi:hypothetical protein